MFLLTSNAQCAEEAVLHKAGMARKARSLLTFPAEHIGCRIHCASSKHGGLHQVFVKEGGTFKSEKKQNKKTRKKSHQSHNSQGLIERTEES